MEQKKAAFLVRCSTNKQDYDRQVEDLLREAERFGFIVYEPIFGEHITGKDDSTKRDRLSIMRMKNDAVEHKFDVVLISEVSRLSRDTVSGRVYVREMCNLGIPMYFRDKRNWTIDLETGDLNEGFIRELGGYFDGAADYLKSLKTQVASGRRTQLSNNLMTIGRPPIGYKRRGGKDRWTKSEIIIDEELSPMIKDIFDLYLEEESTLKSVSLDISHRYKRVSVSHVYQILTRESYATGKMVVSLSDPDRKKQAPEEYVITFDPIVEKEKFDLVQVKLNKNRSSKVPYPEQKTRPLSRLIRCSSCGHAFSPRQRSGDKPGEKYRMIGDKIDLVWLCCSRINNSCECNSHINLNDEKLTSIIWGLVKKELLPYADLNKDEREEKTIYAKKKLEEAEEHIVLCQKEIQGTEILSKRAYTAYINAPESTVELALKNYNETLVQIQKTKSNAEQEISRMNEQIKRCKDTIEYYSRTEVTEEYINSIKDNDEEKRKFFVQLIDKIIPYSFEQGKFVLELYTVNDVYYIIMDARVKKNRLAYYVPLAFGLWQDSNEFSLNDRKRDAYFIVRNYKMLEIPKQVTDPSHVSYVDMKDLCALNEWIYKY